MKWPRGKYNGLRIVGVETKVLIDLTRWRLRFSLSPWNRGLSIGPVHIWISPAYD